MGAAVAFMVCSSMMGWAEGPSSVLRYMPWHGTLKASRADLHPLVSSTSFGLLHRAGDLRTAWDQQLDRRRLHYFAALIAGFAAHRDRSAIRPRARPYRLHDLAFDVEHVARPRRRRPREVSAEANEAAGDR